jgi:predicted GH43/DUF377 family glycosyl hydrolase
MRKLIFVILAGIIFTAGCDQTNEISSDNWQMGPFVKLDQPVLRPDANSIFMCPILKREVRFEQQNVYNPAVVVRDEKIYLLYRADDGSPNATSGSIDEKREGWGRTCRIGLAESADGRNFTRRSAPVLYPDKDFMEKYEWECGLEDPHIVEDEKGTYYLTYNTYDGKILAGLCVGLARLCVATSNDLVNWKKHGQVFYKAYNGKYRDTESRTTAILCRRKGSRFVATKVNGKYWMYYGHPCNIATSNNLIDWEPLEDENGDVVKIWDLPHKGYFDSISGEPGRALMTDKGIVLFYNGLNHNGDPELPPHAWTIGHALLDRSDPTKLLDRCDKPLISADKDWESGFIDNATVMHDGLVYFKGQWLLYYGAGDRNIGLAIYNPEN